MNIKRFHAATSREALAKARMAFGEGTLILSNRPTPTGVEVVATAEDSLTALDSAHEAMLAAAQPKQALRQQPATQPRLPARPAAKAMPVETDPVDEDTAQLAMSTLSFQDYVRERMLRRRHEATNGQLEEAQNGAPLFEARPAPAPAPAPVASPAPRASHAAPFAAPTTRARAAQPAPVAA